MLIICLSYAYHMLIICLSYAYHMLIICFHENKFEKQKLNINKICKCKLTCNILYFRHFCNDSFLYDSNYITYVTCNITQYQTYIYLQVRGLPCIITGIRKWSPASLPRQSVGGIITGIRKWQPVSLPRQSVGGIITGIRKWYPVSLPGCYSSLIAAMKAVYACCAGPSSSHNFT